MDGRKKGSLHQTQLTRNALGATLPYRALSVRTCQIICAQSPGGKLSVRAIGPVGRPNFVGEGGGKGGGGGGVRRGVRGGGGEEGGKGG